jgi:hypothetical protein
MGSSQHSTIGVGRGAGRTWSRPWFNANSKVSFVHAGFLVAAIAPLSISVSTERGIWSQTCMAAFFWAGFFGLSWTFFMYSYSSRLPCLTACDFLLVNRETQGHAVLTV